MKTASRTDLPRSSNRKGATLVESAFTLPLLLLLIFGIIDLGLTVQRAALCHELARIGARMAVVHGADAGEGRVWSADQAVAAIRSRIDPILQAAAVDPDSVQVSVTWQRAGTAKYPNSPGSYVTVQISLTSESQIAYLGLSPVTISSDSRMVISN